MEHSFCILLGTSLAVWCKIFLGKGIHVRRIDVYVPIVHRCGSSYDCIRRNWEIELGTILYHQNMGVRSGLICVRQMCEPECCLQVKSQEKQL